MVNRNYYKKIWEKLSSYKNMIFISGPRQAGKTTFANFVAEDFKNRLYFNWDILKNKKQLIEDPYFFEKMQRTDRSIPLIILDEIHKYKDWKNYLKGVYDKDAEKFKFLVSGSGRLNLFQKGGDSLAGRYLMFNLFPFTLSELSESSITIDSFLKDPLIIPEKKDSSTKIWTGLKKFSGFPEPYIKQKKDFYELWSNNYKNRLLKEDIRDASQIKNIDSVEILFSLLPGRIGSPVSLNNLAKEVQTTFDTIKNRMNLFEKFYLTFSITPWHKKITRAIKKEKKIYLFDYAGIEDPGRKFENMVALELLQAVCGWNDMGFGRFSLHYLRNKEKEEVDFLIANKGEPILLVECKLSDINISKNLLKFQSVLGVPAVQLVESANVGHFISNGDDEVLVITASRWLAELP